ncbi:MAG: thymidylate synthase [Gammaproteobacteria bacterium]
MTERPKHPAGVEGILYDSVQGAWLGELERLKAHGRHVSGVIDPLSIGSNFGAAVRDTIEMTASSFCLANPLDRLTVSSTIRKFDLGFAVGSFLSSLCESNDVDLIAFYNPKGREFAGHDGHLTASLGARLYQDGAQLERAVERLQADPTTRRALVQIHLPSDLLGSARDTSCVGSLHFLLRESQLHCIAHMRSQSAFRVFPYDLFVLTMIHESVATAISTKVGSYYHIANSMHIYDDEVSVVERLLRDPPTRPLSMSQMSPSSLEVRQKLLSAERAIRAQLREHSAQIVDVNAFGLGPYWTRLLAVLVVAVKGRLGVGLTREDVEGVAPEFRYSMVSTG